MPATGETITDVKALIAVSDGLIVRVGKRKIAREIGLNRWHFSRLTEFDLERGNLPPSLEATRRWLSTVWASSAAA